MPIILDHEQKTGAKVMYAFGISHADPDEMMRNHDLVAEAGGNCAVINVNSIGLGGFAFLRKRSRLVLHAHRNGWDILTRHPGLGMEFKVYQQFWRLLGVDQLQINGIRVKYWEPDEILRPLLHDDLDAAVLSRATARCRWSARANGAARRRRPTARTGQHASTCSICAAAASSATRRAGGGRAAPCSRPGRPPWPALRWRRLCPSGKRIASSAQSIEKFGDGRDA